MLPSPASMLMMSTQTSVGYRILGLPLGVFALLVLPVNGVINCGGGVHTCKSGGCASVEFQSCVVDCPSRACQNAEFRNSKANCVGSASCYKSRFYGSEAFCVGSGSKSYEQACRLAKFYATSVYCDYVFACDVTSYDECSCCDGYRRSTCPTYIKSCHVTDKVGFCGYSPIEGGQTCKDMGNPECRDVQLPPPPTRSPTQQPSPSPTGQPSSSPTIGPTQFPTQAPTVTPTPGPTVTPTQVPSPFPTTLPPTKFPTNAPSVVPTQGPTLTPSSPFPTTLTNAPSVLPTQDTTTTTTTVSGISIVFRNVRTMNPWEEDEFERITDSWFKSILAREQDVTTVRTEVQQQEIIHHSLDRNTFSNKVTYEQNFQHNVDAAVNVTDLVVRPFRNSSANREYATALRGQLGSFEDMITPIAIPQIRTAVSESSKSSKDFPLGLVLGLTGGIAVCIIVAGGICAKWNNGVPTNDDLYTRAVIDGRKRDVGELSIDSIPDPPCNLWPMPTDGTVYVFLSHRGGDTKETIARPTHWFLENKLGVVAFLDDENIQTGDDKMLSLIEPAYRCTHALVILSPSFRDSEYCVMELNTFMARWSRRDGITVIPALWHLNDLEGYSKAANDIGWFSTDIQDPAEYMVEALWPELSEMLQQGNQFSREQMGQFLVEYINSHRGHPRADIPAIPASLERYAKNFGRNRQ